MLEVCEGYFGNLVHDSSMSDDKHRRQLTSRVCWFCYPLGRPRGKSRHAVCPTRKFEVDISESQIGLKDPQKKQSESERAKSIDWDRCQKH